jgi:hypothetical protein
MGESYQGPDGELDRLISKSGIIGRQILGFYRFMRAEDTEGLPYARRSINSLWPKEQGIRKLLGAIGVSRVADFLFTYYIGGSLTRQDQLTFARIRGMGNRPQILTLGNVLFCGIPMALFYFLAGKGFHLLSKVNSYAELPAFMAHHISLLIGMTSLMVDLFRAVDAVFRKRCWAPFGILPFVVNMPTYLTRLFDKIGAKPSVGRASLGSEDSQRIRSRG